MEKRKIWDDFVASELFPDYLLNYEAVNR